MTDSKKKLIPDETRDRAKNYPIIELAYRLGIEVKGTVCRCISPSHEDKNPSMSFKIETNTFKCFSCGFHGDTIALVRKARYCEFIEAVEFILNENLNQPSASEQRAQKHPLKRNLSSPQEKGEKYADIYDYFINKLLLFSGESHYLIANRKISIEVLKQNNVKNITDQENRDYYFNELKKVFPEDRLISSGLFPISKKGYPYFAFFNCCAVVPFYRGDKIVYLQGITKPELIETKARDEQKKTPKVFNLTGIQKEELYIPKRLDQKPIHLCEGVITSLFFISQGLDSIAILSANNQLDKIVNELSPYKNNEFILCPDVDPIGLEMFEKLKPELYKQGFEYNEKYFNPIDFARKLGVRGRKLYAIKDFNDLRHYM